METILDTSTSSHPSVQMGIMIDKNGDEILTEDITVNDDSDKSDDPSETSELLGFNLSLFPTSPIFGANVMFQKLQGMCYNFKHIFPRLYITVDTCKNPCD